MTTPTLSLFNKNTVRIHETGTGIGKQTEIKQYKLKLSNNSEVLIPIRGDGMVNATLLCKAGGKKYSNWIQNKGVQDIVNELERSLGISRDLIITTISTGKNEFRGTWIHPDLAIQLAQWISPKFAIQVSRWTRELFITGRVELGNELSTAELDAKYQEKILTLENMIEDKTKEIVLKDVMIEDKTKEIVLKDVIIEEKTKELDVTTKKLEKSEGIRDKFLKRRKRTPYEAGNVVYILSNPGIKSDTDEPLYRVGISTQTGEENVAFRNRLSVYNTAVPQNFMVKSLLYVEDNATIENFVFKTFRNNLVDSNGSWIKGVEFEKLYTTMKNMCEMLNFEFKQVIFNNEEDIKKFDEEVKMEMEAIMKSEKDHKQAIATELEKMKTQKKLEEVFDDEEKIKVARWDEVIAHVSTYSDAQLAAVIEEFNMKKRKGRDITRHQVQSRLTVQKQHPEIYIHDDQKTDAIKQRVLKNIEEYDLYELQQLLTKYTLRWSNRVEDMRNTLRNFLVHNAIDASRCRNVYKYDLDGKLVHHYDNITLFAEQSGFCKNSITNFRDQLCAANGFIYTSKPKEFTKAELETCAANVKTYRQNLTKKDHDNLCEKYLKQNISKAALMEEFNISDSQFKRIVAKGREAASAAK